MNYSKRKPVEVKKQFVFEGVNFYPESWKGKKLEDFIEHEKHHGLSEAQLKEAWTLMNKPADKAKKDEEK